MRRLGGGPGVRDLLLFAFVAALAPVAIAIPYAGVLVWSWLSFMNPHRLTFGAAYDFPIVFWVALLTLGAWLVSRERKFVFREPTSILMLVFLAWTGLSTLTAFDRAWSYPYLEQTFKSFLLAFAVLGLINTKARVQALVWVIAVSLGYYAVKGFGFTLARGGTNIVLGPEHSFIADNNNLGLALAMTLPLLNYLRLSSRRPIVSLMAAFVMVATIVSIVGTYSRGGLIGLLIVGFGLWLLSRHRLMLGALAVALVVSLPSLVPQQWYDRMATIQSYEEDASFQGRVEAWRVNTRIALDRPLTGGGFYAGENPSTFAAYKTTGREQAPTAPHSIYFQVLGDHGFPGFLLYLLIVATSFFNLRAVIRVARQREDLRWAADLATMMQVSFMGFLGAGALLSLAYYDVALVLFALSANLRLMALDALGTSAVPLLPRWRRSREAVTQPASPIARS